MKKHITLLAFVFISFATFGQNKVYWVHGLNDDGSTWTTYKSSLVPSQNQGSSITWFSHYSLESAANKLNSQVNNEVSSSNKAIVFGHSAGGLVARRAAQKNNQIRAVITAGTPNNGAGIVTSLKNRSFNNVADVAVTRIQSSLNLGTQAIASVFSGIAGAIISLIGSTSSLLVEVGKGFGQDELNNIKNYFSGLAAVSDMNPDQSQNTFLRKLNSSAPTIPIINLYGNEDDYRLVRLAGTAQHKKENDSPTNTSDLCFDETAFAYYDGALATCTTFTVLHYTAGTALAVLGYWCPFYLISSALNYTAAVSWTDTKRYLQFDIHNEWDRIIGATHTDRIENWHRFLWWTWCDVEYVTVYENSDGFIPNNSSKMDEGRGPKTNNYELKGVNHLEMNSHRLMRQTLSDILKDGKYGDAFSYDR